MHIHGCFPKAIIKKKDFALSHRPRTIYLFVWVPMMCWCLQVECMEWHNWKFLFSPCLLLSLQHCRFPGPRNQATSSSLSAASSGGEHLLTWFSLSPLSLSPPPRSLSSSALPSILPVAPAAADGSSQGGAVGLKMGCRRYLVAPSSLQHQSPVS